jgi:hypothetical protein
VDNGKIGLRLILTGATSIEVDRAEYEQAKADGEVDQFLDHELSDLDGTNIVIEPDGRSYDPISDAYGLS